MVKSTTVTPVVSADKELQELTQQTAKDTAELTRLERLSSALQKDELVDELLEECPDLSAAFKKVEKLKYRKNILQTALNKQLADTTKDKNDPVAKKSKTEDNKNKVGGGTPKQSKKIDYVIVEDYGSNILGQLSDIFKDTLKKVFPGLEIPVLLAETSNLKFGDYQLNSAMLIAKELKAAGINKKPSEVGEIIKNALPKCDLIEKLDVAPAGFVNIYLNLDFTRREIATFFAEGVQLPKVVKKRVLVDFSSPNIAKEMHVGHLRSTIIGDSICRLLEMMQFDVLRVNHIGDWGTQFGMLIAHLYDRYPDFLTNPPPISDLQDFYKESKKRFDSEEAFKKRAYECVVKLQRYDNEFVQAWNLICDVSKRYNQMVYNRLDIHITDVGESFYQDKMVTLVEDLKKNHSGVLKEEEGRLLMFPTGCDVPLTVVKSDGGYTYDTSDLAALKYRMLEEKVDWALYVVDSGQALHLETIYAAGRDLGWYNPQEQRVEHVGFGLVLGEDRKKFKTRSGESVRLLDLLDVGVERATEKLAEKDRASKLSPEELDRARDAVAYGCIKYADLSHTRTQDYVFSFDRMLDDRGNTAVYLLYAYARIRSISRTSGVSDEQLKAYIAKNPVLPLSHPAEFKLAKQILKLSSAILTVLDSLMLHQLCDYVYTLATIFHDFYTECYVIEKIDGETLIHFERLILCEVTANVIAKCFKILGIPEATKM